MPDHRRAPALTGLIGLLVFFVSGHSFTAAFGAAILLLLAHVSDQLHCLIRQRETREDAP